MQLRRYAVDVEMSLEASDFTRQLFRMFREVFGSDRQQERVIFWIETQRGWTLLRHVRSLGRTRKMQDHLVGRFPNELDVVKAAIGNFAAGCSLTTVRWELYGDFELANLIARGRFDFRDLLPRFETVHGLATHGIFPAGDWDFDNIVLMHRCPNCGKGRNLRSIIYLSHEPCGFCGKEPSFPESHNVVSRLLEKHRWRIERLTVHFRHAANGEFAIQHFVDPVPNSVVYWWILQQALGRITDPLGDFSGKDQQRSLHDLFRASLFKLMAIETIRREFLKYLDEIEQGSFDWEMFLAQLARFGTYLECSTTERVRLRAEEQFLSEEYVKRALPHLVNTIILKHGVAPSGKEVS